MNAHENMRKNNVEEESNYQSNSIPSTFKDTEKNKVHFSNAGGSPPEKDDIISLYGTPKEEIIPGVHSDGYGAEDEDDLSNKGK